MSGDRRIPRAPREASLAAASFCALRARPLACGCCRVSSCNRRGRGGAGAGSPLLPAHRRGGVFTPLGQLGQPGPGTEGAPHPQL